MCGRQKAGDRSEWSEAADMEASLTGRLPADATTKLSWVNNEKMSADSLTKTAKDAFAGHGRSVDRFNSRKGKPV